MSKNLLVCVDVCVRLTLFSGSYLPELPEDLAVIGAFPTHRPNLYNETLIAVEAGNPSEGGVRAAHMGLGIYLH